MINLGIENHEIDKLVDKEWWYFTDEEKTEYLNSYCRAGFIIGYRHALERLAENINKEIEEL